MHCFELRPNCSLTPRAAALFYTSIVVVSLTVAVSFAAAGYWPILPFAGIELLALGWALRVSQRNGRLRELIRVTERHVDVRKSWPGHHRDVQFDRPWTRVDLDRPVARNWPSRLVLRSKGRGVEVGAFLTDEERDGLKCRLTEVIRQQAVH